MKIGILLMWVLTPGLSWGWEPISPDVPSLGQVTTTTITDILVATDGVVEVQPLPDNLGRWVWIAFADTGVEQVCRTINNGQGGITPFSYQDRYVRLEIINPQVGYRFMPLALFAMAHGMRVRVKIDVDGGRNCSVAWLQTCTTPESCAAP